ncbi:RNA methyltransferase [Calothrix sp. 336/3]|uniref:RNA methyltransferase n=1 Tax=Calothrix sp. 336/3 TaxID=1337936 RepID=UPI0004E33F80|nr:RNA methyltransferase [Calothrix sp. 336/3]AKG21677.1 RNA methyltransferase [Calothrix sp. 336/3]
MTIADVRIILVEPAGALNLGSIARVMKNFGLRQLYLVNPRCDRHSPEAQLMAVHAKDILESAVITQTLPAALTGCKRAIATTGIHHDWNAPLEPPRTTLPWLLEEIAQPAALIFGREDRGLTNQELNYAQKFLRIPTDAAYSSLNLATAVALCCYELSQSLPLSPKDTCPQIEIAPQELVEAYYQQLESLLLKIGYLYPHTSASRMEKFRQLYNRAELQVNDVAMLRGIIRQIEWSLSNPHEKENS